MNLNLFAKKSGISTATIDELQQETLKREIGIMNFPLHIFNRNLNPFIQELETNYKLPRSFIGLSLLTAYSSAIGGGYMVSTNGVDMFPLAFYSSLVGMTSSAKSLTIKKCFSFLIDEQVRIDRQWKEETADLKQQELEAKRMKTLIYRDSHLTTLLRSVLPYNSKGVTRILDELIEWINSMNQLSKKEGIDEQIWLSTWDGVPYSAIRSGNQKFTIEKPFIGIIGGIQYQKLKELFKNDRGFSGFISRILFAVPEVDEIPLIHPEYSMNAAISSINETLQEDLYNRIEYKSYDQKPFVVKSTAEANKLYYAWVIKHTKRINAIREFDQKELEAAIFGKMKNYILRIGAILSLVDKHFDPNHEFVGFRPEEELNEKNMGYAIECAEYFTKAAIFVALYAKKETIAPTEALQLAALTKTGRSLMEIGKIMFGHETDANKMKVARLIKHYSALYPKTFNATPK